MKKTFQLTAPNKKPERQCDSVKFEIRKYIARERRKKLPDGVDYWDFDCRIGQTESDAQVIHVETINKNIDELSKANKTSFYMEILAKPGIRKKRFSQKQHIENSDDEDFDGDDEFEDDY